MDDNIKYSLVLKNKARGAHAKWYIRVRKAGCKERLVCTGSTTKEGAERFLAQYREAPAPAMQEVGAIDLGMTVRKATEKWEAWLRILGMSEGTIRNYTQGVLRVLDGSMQAEAVDRAAVVAGFSSVATLASATRRALSVYTHAFLGWLNDNYGEKWKEAYKACPRVKAVSNHKHAWTDDEIRRILSCIHHARPEVEAQYRLFFTIMATVGCRDGELRALRWEDVGADRITFRAANTKSRSERTVPINRTVQMMMGDLREASGEVFPLIARTNTGRNIVLRSAMFRAEVKEGSMHSFRTSLATRWAREGIPVKATQQLLGHSSPSTTLEYYTAQESVDSLRKFVEGKDVTKW